MSPQPGQCWCLAVEPQQPAGFTWTCPGTQYISATASTLRRLCSKNKQPLCFRMSSYKQLIMAQKHSVTRDCFPRFIFPSTIPLDLVPRSQKTPANYPQKAGTSAAISCGLGADSDLMTLPFSWFLPPRKAPSVSQQLSPLFPPGVDSIIVFPLLTGLLHQYPSCAIQGDKFWVTIFTVFTVVLALNATFFFFFSCKSSSLPEFD